MLQNAYFLAKIGADTAENEQHFAEILPKTGNYPTGARPARLLRMTGRRTAASRSASTPIEVRALGWRQVSSHFPSHPIEVSLGWLEVLGYRKCEQRFEKSAESPGKCRFEVAKHELSEVEFLMFIFDH